MKQIYSTLLASTMVLVSPLLPAQDRYGQPDTPLAAVVLGTEIHTSDPEEMKYEILNRLQDR